jgi:transcriptional regulator with XRE-family HTH domain
MNETDTPNIAEIIRDVRKSLNLTQPKFAKLLGLTRSQIADYETGRSMIRGDNLLRIMALKERVTIPQTME